MSEQNFDLQKWLEDFEFFLARCDNLSRPIRDHLIVIPQTHECYYSAVLLSSKIETENLDEKQWELIRGFEASVREICSKSHSKNEQNISIFGYRDELTQNLKNISQNDTGRREASRFIYKIKINDTILPALVVAQCGNHPILLTYCSDEVDEAFYVSERGIWEPAFHIHSSDLGNFILLGCTETHDHWIPYAKVYSHVIYNGRAEIRKGLAVTLDNYHDSSEFSVQFTPFAVSSEMDTNMDDDNLISSMRNSQKYQKNAILFGEEGEWQGFINKDRHLHRLHHGQFKGLNDAIQKFCRLIWLTSTLNRTDFDILIKHILDNNTDLPILAGVEEQIRQTIKKSPQAFLNLRLIPLQRKLGNSFLGAVQKSLYANIKQGKDEIEPVLVLLLYSFYKGISNNELCEVRFFLKEILPEVLGESECSRNALKSLSFDEWLNMFRIHRDTGAEIIDNRVSSEIQKRFSNDNNEPLVKIQAICTSLASNEKNEIEKAYNFFDTLNGFNQNLDKCLTFIREGIGNMLQKFRECISTNYTPDHLDFCHAASLARCKTHKQYSKLGWIK